MQQFHRTKTTDRCDFEGQTRSHSLRTPFTFSNRAIIGFVLMRNHNKTSQKEYDLKEINDIAKQTCKCFYLYTNIIQTKNIYYQQTVGTAFHVSVPLGACEWIWRIRRTVAPVLLPRHPGKLLSNNWTSSESETYTQVDIEDTSCHLRRRRLAREATAIYIWMEARKISIAVHACK